jgi:hypothetical protein
MGIKTGIILVFMISISTAAAMLCGLAGREAYLCTDYKDPYEDQHSKLVCGGQVYTLSMGHRIHVLSYDELTKQVNRRSLMLTWFDPHIHTPRTYSRGVTTRF